MERGKKIQRAMFAIMVMDAILLFLLVVVSLHKPWSLVIFAAIYLQLY